MSERPFIVGDSLELQLLLPTAPRPIMVGAKVAWTKLAKLGLIELGVTFDPVEEGIQATIHTAVEHFLRGEGKR